MPRRNRRFQHASWWRDDHEADMPPTCDDMARDLVARGLASPQILDPTRHPVNRPTDNRQREDIR